MIDTINILLIEDDNGDAKLLERSFSKIKTFKSNITRAISVTNAIAELENSIYDVILLDLSLPDGDGIEIIDRVSEFSSNTPIVVLTGLNDEALAMEAVNRGAHEFLVKGEISNSFLPIVIRYAIESARNNAELEKSKLGLEKEVEKRTSELKIAHSRALRSERLAAIGEMVAGLAHESRNALQRIQASTNRLNRRAKDNKGLIDISNDIELAVDDLNHLYNTVREYALPLKLNIKKADLKKVFLQTLTKIESSNTIAPEILFDVFSDNLEVEIDALAIQQVFRNLLENSIQAIHPKKATILFKAELEDLNGVNFINLTIVDDGPGITQELTKKLFEPFYTTKNTGTGLGMAIIKRIVEGHRGVINIACDEEFIVKDKKFKGLALKISFPVLYIEKELSGKE